MKADRVVVVVVGVVAALAVGGGVLISTQGEGDATREQVNLGLLEDCLGRAQTPADIEQCRALYRARR